MRKHLRLVVFILALALLACVGFYAYVVVADAQCMGLALNRRVCILMQSPLLWVRQDEPVNLPPGVPLPATVAPLRHANDIQRLMTDQEIQSNVQQIRKQPGVGAGAFVLRSIGSQQADLNVPEFHVTLGEVFQGSVQFVVFYSPTEALAVSCWVDLIQQPCQPNGQNVQTHQLKVGVLNEVPITLPGLTPGMHDLEVTMARRLENSYPVTSSMERQPLYLFAARGSIVVGDIPTPRTITYQNVPLPFAYFGVSGVLTSKDLLPLDELGGFHVDTDEITAKPGGRVTLYLHVFNDQTFAVDYGIVGLWDYEQIPITYAGQSHEVFYIKAQPRAWYAIPINVDVHGSTGRHELFFASQAMPRLSMKDQPREPFLFVDPIAMPTTVRLVVHVQ